MANSSPKSNTASPNCDAVQDPVAGRAALVEEVEQAALQVMLQGAAACSPELLERLAGMASAIGLAGLAAQVQAAAQQHATGSLTEEGARSLIMEMQSALAAPSQDTAAEVPAAVVETEDPQMFAEDPELLNDFVMEADEHIASIEEKILLLEKDSSAIEDIHAVFRSFHSIKGLAGFLGLKGVQLVAHEVETLLDHARNLRIVIGSQMVDLVLDSAEYLKDEIEVIRAKLAGTPLPPVRDNSALVKTLTTATSDIAAGRPCFQAEAAAQDPPPAAEEAMVPVPEQAAPAPVIPAPAAPIIPVATEIVSPRPLDVPSEVVEAKILETPAAVPTVSNIPVPPAPSAPPPPVTTAAAPPSTIALVPAVAKRPDGEQAAAAAPTGERRSDLASTSIRVETAKLDRLMDMVGEMVIAQSILSNIPQGGSPAAARIAGEMSQLSRITTEVQRCAMSMRMMPIGPLFQKNAKMVRDLSRRNGKQVALELFGETTELDKSIAEELSDPLLHMIRNALDHGIETPAERAATGKTPIASLRIAAEHQAGQIVISISDDGRGLNPTKIRKKAIENGLIEESEQLTEAEIFHLIFAPGFSTAEKITDISGRGVGMDVVRQHVESLRGRIDIKSVLGEGTTFLIRLPLTLAIIEGLVIVVGEHRYIIPLYSVREMFRPTIDMLFTVKGAEEVILMRGSLLPLIRLHRRFEITPRTDDICEGLLVVCEFSGKRFCLFVDDLLGRQEVVIKSLDEAFRKVRGLVGSAILGDGRIGLILDVAGVFNAAISKDQEQMYA